MGSKAIWWLSASLGRLENRTGDRRGVETPEEPGTPGPIWPQEEPDVVPWTQLSLPGISGPLALSQAGASRWLRFQSLSQGDHTPGRADHGHLGLSIALRLTQSRTPQHWKGVHNRTTKK